MKHYIELDWPRLTDHQVSKILEYYEQNGRFPIPQLQDRDNDAILLDPQTEQGRIDKYRFFNSIFPYKRIDSLKNYPLNWVIQGMSMVKVVSGNLEPHTDIARKIGLYYVIQGDADSVWYEYPDGSLPVAGKSYIKEVADKTVVEVERVKFKPHTWYVYDFAAIHSVENSDGQPRIGFGIGLPVGVFKSFEDLQTHPERDIRLQQILLEFLGISHGLVKVDETDQVIYDLATDASASWTGWVQQYQVSDGSTAWKFVK